MKVGVSTWMLSTSSSASLSRPCRTGRVTTTYLRMGQQEPVTSAPDSVTLTSRPPPLALLLHLTSQDRCGRTGVSRLAPSWDIRMHFLKSRS